MRKVVYGGATTVHFDLPLLDGLEIFKLVRQRVVKSNVHASSLTKGIARQ